MYLIGKKIIPSLYSFCELGAGVSFSNNHLSAFGSSFYFTPGISYRIHKYIDLELLLPNLARMYYNTTKTTNNYGTSSIVSSITVRNSDGTTTTTTTTTYRNGSNGYSSTNTNSSFGLSTSLGFSSLALGVKIIL